MSETKSNRDPEQMDVIDALHRNSAQLAALLTSIAGQGFENFQLQTPDNQDHLLFLASNLADRICEGTHKL